MKKKVFLLVFVFFTLLPLTSEVYAQCPMCRAGVESSMKDEKNKAVGTGLNNGILFLLASPYVLIGTAFIIWRKKSKTSKPDERNQD